MGEAAWRMRGQLVVGGQPERDGRSGSFCSAGEQTSHGRERVGSSRRRKRIEAARLLAL